MSPAQAIGHSRSLPQSTIWILGGVTAIGLLLALSLIFLFVLNPFADRSLTAPSEFGPVWGPVSLGAGALGCSSPPGDLCYSFGVQTLIPSLAASSLRFVVSNSSVLSFPMPNNVPLGPNATVTMLGSSATVASWDWATGSWSSGAGYVLPENTNIELVLDTGLTSKTTLLGNIFCVELAVDGGGVTGFFFH